MKLLDVVIDNKDGWGQVPNNQNVDYMGIRVQMRPSMFAKLAATLTTPPSEAIKDHIAKGGAIGAPFLQLNVPRHFEDHATVVGHEGRNRMIAVYQVDGDAPIEVHIFFRGEVERNRHITKEVNTYLNTGLYAERSGGILVKGPFWEVNISEESAGVGIITKQNTTVDVKPGATKRQAAKFGNKINKKNEPPLLTASVQNSDLDSLLVKLEELMEDINSESMYADSEEDSKKLERDYRALHAVENVIRNNLLAERKNILDKNVFHYDINPKTYTWGGIHVQIKGDVGEIKWIGSYNSSGRKLLNTVKPELKKRGVKKLKLTAKWESEGFYDKMNFKRDSETRDDPIVGTSYTDMSKGIDESMDVEGFAQQLKQKYNLKDLWMVDMDSRNAIELSSIIVNKDKQKTGIGTQVMTDIVNFADEHGKIVVLDLGVKDKTHGTTSKSRLRKFYTRFGFVNNKGRNKNFEFRSSMIRNPKKSVTESIKYPIASRDDWYGDLQYKEHGAKMVMMTPTNYLAKVRPLTLDDVSIENIDILAQHMKDGGTLDPLKIDSLGKEDGRHRAYAAKKLGIAKVPVIVYPQRMKESTQLNELFDKSYDWKWTTDHRRGSFRTGRFFTSDHRPIDVDFAKKGSTNKWGVIFAINDVHVATGEGDEFRIFATVIQIIGAFIKEMEPDKLYFTAEKPVTPNTNQNSNSRSSLYTRMIKRFAGQVGMTAKIDDMGYKTNFTLIKEAKKSSGPTYELQLIRSRSEDVLKIKSSRQPSWVEIRGKGNYEVKHDPNDPLHSFLDKLDAPTVAALMAGDTKFLNPNNPRTTPSIDMAQDIMANESQLNELFDKVYDWNWKRRDKKHWEAIFHSESDEIVMTFVLYIDAISKENVWKAAFAVRPKGDLDIGSFTKTGGGDQFGIFATILDIMKEFFQIVNPTEVVKFTADKDVLYKLDSREKLYTHMIKKFATQVNRTAVVTPGLVGTRYELHPIEETNEDIKKPHPKDTLGVKREDMPQVQQKYYPELLKYLAANGGRFKTKEVEATQLKAVQSEFSDQGVEKMMKKKGVTQGKRKPLIISADNYIIDGHHRWLAAVNMKQTVPVMQISIPVKELMQLVRDFKHTTYKTIYNESFDSAYHYIWTARLNDKFGHWEGKFTTKDESDVKLMIHKMGIADWQETLFAHGIAQDEFPPVDEDEPIYNIDFTRDRSIELTGGGDQMAIFATIIKMISEFFNTVKPTQIVFGAEKDNSGIVGSRAKLYKRFASFFAKQIGYKSLSIDVGREAYFYIYSPSIIAEKYTAMQIAVMEGGHCLEDLEENLSIIGTEQHQEERRKKLRPGTKAWFKHWFARPHLTRGEVDTLKEEIFTYIKSHRGVQNEKTINNRGFNND